MESLVVIVILAAVVLGYVGYVLNSRNVQEAGQKMQKTASGVCSCVVSIILAIILLVLLVMTCGRQS